MTTATASTPPTLIHDLAALAAHTGAAHVSEASVGRRLYKDTACGIGFALVQPGTRPGREATASYILTLDVLADGGLRLRRAFDCTESYEAFDAEQEHDALATSGIPAAVLAWAGIDPETRVSKHSLATVLRGPNGQDAQVSGPEVSIHTGPIQYPTSVAHAGGVRVSGYCEGSDAECPPYTLYYPFSAAAFDAAVRQADKDGGDVWNDTHGCPQCHGGLGYEDGGTNPVDPDCAACSGAGECI